MTSKYYTVKSLPSWVCFLTPAKTVKSTQEKLEDNGFTSKIIYSKSCKWIITCTATNHGLVIEPRDRQPKTYTKKMMCK